MVRAFSGSPVGRLIQPAFRVYSTFDLIRALADCAELDVYGERVEENEFYGCAAEELASQVGSDIISVSVEGGLARLSAPKLQVRNFEFQHEMSWQKARRDWAKKNKQFITKRRWDSKKRSWQ